MLKVLVVHGPNLNLLGTRESSHYGQLTLAQINDRLAALACELGIELETFQHNYEGALVDKIQQCPQNGIAGLVVNPAAYGHTSIALRDALLAVGLPFVEVHISNVYKRESFRHQTFLSDIAAGVVVGLGADSYLLGLRGLLSILSSVTPA